MPGVRSLSAITSGYAGSDFISGKLARFSLVSDGVLNELAIRVSVGTWKMIAKKWRVLSRVMCFLEETDNILQRFCLARY